MAELTKAERSAEVKDQPRDGYGRWTEVANMVSDTESYLKTQGEKPRSLSKLAIPQHGHKDSKPWNPYVKAGLFMLSPVGFLTIGGLYMLGKKVLTDTAATKNKNLLLPKVDAAIKMLDKQDFDEVGKEYPDQAAAGRKLQISLHKAKAKLMTFED